MEILLATILIIFLTIVIYLKCNRNARLLSNIPGPPTTFLFGNALEFPTSKEVIPNFERYAKDYGTIVKVSLGPIPNMLLITDYKLVEFLLSSPTILRKSQQYSYLYRWLGSTGLVLSDGDEKWRIHRKMLTPTFHFKILNEFIPLIEKFANIFVNKLKSEVGKSSFNVYPYVSLCTLDIICETAMGTSVNAQSDSESDYVKSIAEICSLVIERTFNPLLMLEFFYKFSPQYRREKKAVKITHDYVNSVIFNRRKEFEEKADKLKARDDIGRKRKQNFLDVLLEYQKDGQQLSDEYIREEVTTFMFAGHETTATVISFTLYCIAQFPKVQKKIVEEIKTILDINGTTTFSLRDLENMKYLEAVIKESMRVYPPVPVMGRNSSKDIQFGDLILPKDVDLIIFNYAIHRNSKAFIHPEKFIPDRHLSKNSVYRLPYEYIPFSAGSRNCIGQKLAMLEMKCVVATLLRNYELLPAFPEQRPDVVAEVVLQSRNGVSIRLIDRVD